MYKIGIYGCAMFKKLVCQWINNTHIGAAMPSPLVGQLKNLYLIKELWAFFISRTRPRVNRVLRNQLAGDVLTLVAYCFRYKHYFAT